MKRAALAAIAIAALALAGCGSVPEAETETEDEQPITLSAGQVVTQFRAEPGSPRLRRAAVADSAWEQLGLGLNVSDALLRRYGVFTIYVVEPGNNDAVKSLLSDKSTGEPLQPDDRGVYWELDTQSGDYVAYSRYGANVVVAWFGGTSRPATDARWERLDRVMEALTR